MIGGRVTSIVVRRLPYVGCCRDPSHVVVLEGRWDLAGKPAIAIKVNLDQLGLAVGRPLSRATRQRALITFFG